MTRNREENGHRRILRDGDLTVLGRIRSASNATFLCEASLPGLPEGDDPVHCVYKPVAGEQPLWDFPDGTLAGREYATYLVSQSLGWNIVPHTIIRDGPAGPGMLQRWIEQSEETPELVDLCAAGRLPAGYLPVLQAYDYRGDEVTLIHADDLRLRRMAVFDLLVNNADRKGGHILRGLDGGVYGVDHGLCLHTHDKLRTVLWGWAGKPIADDMLESVAALVDALDGEFAQELAEHITVAEVAALRRRGADMLETPVLPGPDRRRPIPWPAF
ncbi:MAG TPA: SCO1664 family protein [Mycobacterium sp.]|nr:SCO1664 family protein [Mycobacterium sp.]